MGFGQFVALIAAMMATNALAIDSMLPAMPQIGHALGVATDNERQWILTAYLLGFGAAQIVYGPLADRYGRKPVLLVGLALYVVFAALCAFSTSFEMLLIARALCGVGAAATPGAGGVDRPRLLQRPADGAGDVAVVHRLPGRADHRPVGGPGHPAGRALALGVRRAVDLRPGGDRLVVDQAARDPASGRPHPLGGRSRAGGLQGVPDQPDRGRLHSGRHPGAGRAVRLPQLGPAGVRDAGGRARCSR